MSTHFQIEALDATNFQSIFEKNEAELAQIGAVRMTVDKKPGFPCRVSLQDAEVGEEVVLLPFQFHASGSPYQASGPIFVRKNVSTAALAVDEIPKMLDFRLLSVRAYDSKGMMKTAAVAMGEQLRPKILEFFADAEIEYLHLHNAKPGCYNCSVRRAKN